MVKHPKDWKWSSYRATAGFDRAEKWLEVDWLLGQFGKERKKAQKSYRTFVEEGMGKKEKPWDDLYSRIYLGGKEFLEKVHEVGQRHKHLDVPKYQKHVVKQDPKEVLEKVGRMYGEKPEEILSLEKPFFRVGEIPGHLSHPNLIGVVGYAREMNLSVLEADEEQNVIGDKPKGG